MAGENGSGYSSSAPSEAHARLLYLSLKKYDKEQMSRRRPSVILAALISLLLSSAGGITLAIVLMVKVVEKEAGCLSRDLILFAATISMFYIGLHVRGARKDFRRQVSGPPQMYGQYFYATALLIARLGICVWVAALIATAILMARDIPSQGLSTTVPVLNLLICIGALPSFLIISITIEKNPFPFATTAISSNSFLTCRVSEFADDLTADLSVSRRASLQRRQIQPNPGPTVTVQMEEDALGLGGGQLEEKAAAALALSLDAADFGPLEPAGPPPFLLQPMYYPGGWRTEWDMGLEDIDDNVTVPALSPDYSPLSPQLLSPNMTSPFPFTCPPTPHMVLSSEPDSIPNDNSYIYFLEDPAKQEAVRAQCQYPQWQGPLPNTKASTCIPISTARSRLAIVRYASDPEVAVREPRKVVWNSAHPGNYIPYDRTNRPRDADRFQTLRAMQASQGRPRSPSPRPQGPRPMGEVVYPPSTPYTGGCTIPHELM